MRELCIITLRTKLIKTISLNVSVKSLRACVTLNKYVCLFVLFEIVIKAVLN